MTEYEPTRQSKPNQYLITGALDYMNSINRIVSLRLLAKGGLFECGKSAVTLHNIALALAYLEAGEAQIAKQIITGIEANIGFAQFGNGLLVLNSPYGENMYAGDSALVSVFYSRRGRKDLAEKLVEGIENHIGFATRNGHRFVKPNEGMKKGPLLTFTNAALASAYANLGQKGRADELLETIEKEIKCIEFDDKTKLYKSGYANDLVMTQANAMLATAYLETGNEKGVNVMDGICRHIKNHYGKRGTFVRQSNVNVKASKDDLILDTALVARMYWLRAKYEEDRNGQ